MLRAVPARRKACGERGRQAVGPGGWLTRKTDQPCTGRAKSTASRLNGEASSDQEGLELVRRHRVADPVALGQVAAAFAQDRVLAFLFHALGDHRESQ